MLLLLASSKPPDSAFLETRGGVGNYRRGKYERERLPRRLNPTAGAGERKFAPELGALLHQGGFANMRLYERA